MKTDYRDGLAVLFYVLCATGSGLLLSQSYPGLQSLLGDLSPIAAAGGFLSLYGILSAIYLVLFRRFFPLQPGYYDMSVPVFTLWKHQTMIAAPARSALRLFFPMILTPQFYRLFGARISSNVTISGDLADPDMVTIGSGTIVGRGALILGHMMMYNRFIIKPVEINERATIGANAVIGPGTVIGRDAVVMAGAVVPPDTTISAGEVWGGIPAKPVRSAQDRLRAQKTSLERRSA